MSENESEKLLEKSRNKLEGFIRLLKEIDACTDHEELKKLLEKEENVSLIKDYSPIMNKRIQNMENLSLEKIRKICNFLLIPEN